MAKVNYKAVLSLTEPNHQIFLRFRQDDTQTQTLSVEITANGRLFPFVGYTVEFVNITRSDSGQPIIERVDKVYPQEARIEFTLGARSLQWLGKNKAYFSFKDADGNEVFSTQNFEYEVVRGVHKELIKDSGYLWQVEEVLEKANQLIKDVRGTLGEEAATALAMKLNGHIEDKNNPHGVTKEQVGLGNVPNYGLATNEEAQEGTSNKKLMTPQSVAHSIGKMAVTTSGDQDVKGEKNFLEVPKYNGKSLIPTSSNLYIDSGFKNYTTGWVRMERYGELIIIHYSLSPRNNSGTWMTIIDYNTILPEYRLAGETYSSGGIGSSEIADASCVVGMNEQGLQFASWNRPSGVAPFTGQVLGMALNK